MFEIVRSVNNHRLFGLNGCFWKGTSIYCDQMRTYSEDESNHPIRRTLRLLRNDMRKVKKFFTPNKKRNQTVDSEHVNLEKDTNVDMWSNDSDFQTHCDVLVIGGGGIAYSTAYWIKQKVRDGLNVVVLDHEFQQKYSNSMFSFGALQQQFHLPENIQMSLCGAEFIRNTKENLGNINLDFVPYGSLLLANEENADKVRQMSTIQNELGVRTEILSPDRLKLCFPWLNTEGVALGCHGLEKMGWFNHWSLLAGLKYKSKEYGAHFVNAELIDFEFKTQSDVAIEEGTQSGIYHALDKAVVKMPDGETRTIKFAICVLAAGIHSKRIAHLAKIGNGTGILRIPLPLKERQYNDYVFQTNSINTSGLCTPYTICSDGTRFRRSDLSGAYAASFSSPIDSENSSETEPSAIESKILPKLTQNIKAFKSAKLSSTSASRHEYNYFDENGIVGPHPYYNNLYLAVGFSGQGMQQAPAVGRAISELIIDGQFRTIDLTRLGFDRLVVARPMVETNVF